jgi:hypothetical protein
LHELLPPGDLLFFCFLFKIRRFFLGDAEGLLYLVEPRSQNKNLLVKLVFF